MGVRARRLRDVRFFGWLSVIRKTRRMRSRFLTDLAGIQWGSESVVCLAGFALLQSSHHNNSECELGRGVVIGGELMKRRRGEVEKRS